MTSILDRADTAAAVPHHGRPLPRGLVAPVMVGLIGLAIGVIGAATPSIWYDEAATITSATRTWPQLLVEIRTVDLVHAAYYAGLHLWFDLVGYSPFTLRAPSALALGLAAAFVVVLGRQQSRGRLGVIAGVVFCLLPRATWAGGEGRSYSLTALLAVVLTLLLVRAIRSDRRRWWLAYSALAVVGCVVFLYLALVIVAHGVSMIWAASSQRSLAPRMRRWLRWTGCAFVAILPFALIAVAERDQIAWLPPIDSHTLPAVLRDQWFMTSAPFAVVGWIGITGGALVLLLRRRVGISAARILIPAVVVPTLGLLAVSVTLTPIYTPRYLTMCLPFVALLIAAAITAIGRNPLQVAALGVIALVAVPQIWEQRQPLAKERSDWSTVAQLISTQRAEDLAEDDGNTAVIFDTLQHHPGATARLIEYGYPEAFAGIVDVTLDVPVGEAGDLWETTSPLTDSLDRLDGVDATYLLTSTAGNSTADTTAALAPLGWSVTDSWAIADVRVVRFSRD